MWRGLDFTDTGNVLVFKKDSWFFKLPIHTLLPVHLVKVSYLPRLGLLVHNLPLILTLLLTLFPKGISFHLDSKASPLDSRDSVGAVPWKHALFSAFLIFFLPLLPTLLTIPSL